MTTFSPAFYCYTKCSIQDCIHEAQLPGELCHWHYNSNRSKKKHGKATVQQELDMMHDIADAVAEVPMQHFVKKVTSE